MQLIIGNRCYSSWSLRGWLAAKQSGLAFETQVLPMDTPEWDSGASKGSLPSGKVPVIWDGDVAVWDSLAIIDWLGDKVGRDKFWPRGEAARALAYAMCAEMHAGFTALRGACSMDLKQRFPHFEPAADVRADAARIDALWTEARAKFGGSGPYLFGDFGAADIMYAPVVTRFDTYGLPASPVAKAYIATMLAHPWIVEWTSAAKAETYPFARYLKPGGVPA